MNWLDLATELIASDARPVIILDAGGVVRLVNGAFELLARVSASNLVGRVWTDLQESSQVEPRLPLPELLTRPASHRSSTVNLKSGRQFEIHWSSTPVGEPAMGVVIRILRTKDQRQGCAPTDLSYRIKAGTEFELIESSVSARGGGTGRPCYRELIGVDEPCVGCPAQRLSQTAGEVQTVVLGASGLAPMRIVKAQRQDDQSISVAATFVDDERYRQLFHTRLDTISARARLTSRERQVLHALVSGLPIKEVAANLGITSRTAKFHQARILGKLGADSRIDLFRLVS